MVGHGERHGGPRNVVVLLLDSLNRHMLGSYGDTEFETPHLDRFARERVVRFTSHVTGSLPWMPARHDILCGIARFPLATLGLHRGLGGAHHGAASGGPA